MKKDLLADLNDPQREATTHPGGPLLVFAGAGSGKTRVLTRRVVWLIAENGIRSDEILAVTFTNKAAKEMRERVEKILGAKIQRGFVPSLDEAPLISTFHSFGVRFLRNEFDRAKLPARFTILDAGDAGKLIKKIVRAMNVDEKINPPKKIAATISRAKNAGITAIDFVKTVGNSPFERVVADAFESYEREKTMIGAVDFDDLILFPAMILRDDSQIRKKYAERFRYILVDEYQDTNRVQYEIIRALASMHGNLTVVGDDDQSIYAWRGADHENILRFEKDFKDAKTIVLGQNYRSTGTIISAASGMISANKKRHPKKMWTSNDPGSSIDIWRCRSGEDEARRIASEIVRIRNEG